MKQSEYLILLFALALAIACFFVGRLTVKPDIVKEPYIIERVKFDTVEKQITLQPIVRTFKSDTIIYIDNQTIQTKPFIASKDTILNGDTIGVKYSFPQDSFYLKVLPKPLVYKEISKTEFVVKVEKIERPLYVDILSHSGAGLLGGLIGYLIGK